MPQNSDQYVPKSQQWFMEIMFALGYLKCDLVESSSFDGTNFENLPSQSDIVFVIANDKFYFVDRANNNYEEIEIDDEKLKNLANKLNFEKSAHAKDEVLIDGLSFNQLKIIEAITKYKSSFRGGMCHGVATMAVPTNLLDDKREIQRFNRRFRLASLALPERGIDTNFESSETKKSLTVFAERFEKAKQNVIKNQREFKEVKNTDIKSVSDVRDDIDSKVYARFSTAHTLEEIENEGKSDEEKSSLDRAILELRSFFDGIAISQSPKTYNYLFKEKITYQSTKPVMPLITPVSLDDKSRENQPVKLDDDIALFCNTAELEIFFKLFEKHFNGVTFSMILQNVNHSINVSFHPSWDPPWVLTDANNLPATAIESASIAEFTAKQLFSENGLTVFSGEIFVVNKNLQCANHSLTQLKSDPDWIKLCEVTEERAKKTTPNLDTWLHCAARTNNEKLVTDLLAQGADPAKSNKNGSTPYGIAIQRNSRTASIIWSKLAHDFLDLKSDQTARGKLISGLQVNIKDVQEIESKTKNEEIKFEIENILKYISNTQINIEKGEKSIAQNDKNIQSIEDRLLIVAKDENSASFNIESQIKDLLMQQLIAEKQTKKTYF